MPDPTLKITSDVLRADGQNRVSSTAAQGGAAGAVVVVGEWIAQEAFGWDGSLPTAVSAAMIVLLASAASTWKNRAKLRGHS